MNPEYLSQVGFGIVAAAFGWWAWHLWCRLTVERTEHTNAINELNDTHLEQIALLTDKLINWSDVVRTALDQNTDALKGLRDGFHIYESLEEMREFVRRQGQGPTG